MTIVENRTPRSKVSCRPRGNEGRNEGNAGDVNWSFVTFPFGAEAGYSKPVGHDIGKQSKVSLMPPSNHPQLRNHPFYAQSRNAKFQPPRCTRSISRDLRLIPIVISTTSIFSPFLRFTRGVRASSQRVINRNEGNYFIFPRKRKIKNEGRNSYSLSTGVKKIKVILIDELEN